jgi:hypothetical protein
MAPRLVTTTTSPRSPERARLAAMIERHREATAAVARLAQARERAPRPWSFDARLDAAQAALDEARGGAPARAVAELLGEAVEPALSVTATTATLAEIEQEASKAREIHKLLDDREREAAEEVSLAETLLRAAIADTCTLAPEIAGLFVELDAAEVQLAAVRAALLALGPTRLPNTSRARLWDLPRGNWRDEAMRLPVFAEWRAAIEALRLDPDAPLPTLPVRYVERIIVDPNPPGGAAA